MKSRLQICSFLAIPVILSLLSGPVLPARNPGMSDLLGDSPPQQLFSWARGHVRAVDDVLDVPEGFEGADILAFYFGNREMD